MISAGVGKHLLGHTAPEPITNIKYKLEKFTEAELEGAYLLDSFRGIKIIEQLLADPKGIKTIITLVTIVTIITNFTNFLHLTIITIITIITISWLGGLHHCRRVGCVESRAWEASAERNGLFTRVAGNIGK